MASTINLQSKDGGGDGSGGVRGVSSPWSKIVSGEIGELTPPPTIPVVSVTAPVASASSSSVQESIVNASTDWNSPKAVREMVNDSGTECQTEGSDNGGNAVKKPVWSKPSNGVVEVVSPVMGAVSWPALGESTKAAPKSSSSESLQALSDGSLLPPALQVSVNSSPPSHKLATNPTSTPNHLATSGQRSVKRSGVGSGAFLSSNGGVSQRSSATQDSKVESSHNTSGKPGTVSTESHPKDLSYKESPRASFGSQPNSGNDHHRNSYRRGNGGQHPRGDGSYHHSYGGKLDHGRGNGSQEWNQHRNFNNRDSNMHPQRGLRRGYIQRPSVHNSTPYIHPPMPVPIRPFGNHVMYPGVDVASAMIYVPGATPLVGPMPAPMYFPVPDPLLHGKIVNQIDYYFSNENLVKDTYLRRNMDEQGWVPVSLIAGFKKVSLLTDNVQLILDVMRTSTVVEVQGEKMRRRNDWMKWLMPPPVQYSSSSSPQNVPRSLSQDSLVSHIQGISLDEGTSKNQLHVESFSSRSSSGELSSQLQQGGGGGAFERAAVA